MKIAFNDCMDKIYDVMESSQAFRVDNTAGIGDNIYIFYNKCGKLTPNAESEFIKVFSENENVELVYGDEGYPTVIPWYKPDFSPDTLESFFYIGNVFAIRAKNLEKITDDICIYEMVLRIAQNSKFFHIPKVLFINGSDDESLKLSGFGDMDFKERETLNGDELVSVIIPSKDNSKTLEKCISSLKEKTEGVNYEIIVVDNGSSESERMCINSLIQIYGFRYIYERQPFNFSSMCNIGARAANGNLLLFLNDDIEIIDSKWMYNMLLSALKERVGAVGAKLLYPDLSIQHIGITNMGIGPAHKIGKYHGHSKANYNMIALTGACLMVKRTLFNNVGGFDETLPIAYNDVELCFRLYKAGFYNVVRNDAVLIHHESMSRGSDISPEKKKRLIDEKHRLYEKHPDMRACDSFYSPNLVQWKWDREYNENIIYKYDKEITPVILTQKEIKKLPREHKNKYIKKLSGESLLMFNIDGVDYIDSIENMYNKNMILIRGWVALRNNDNSDMVCKKHLLLKNFNDKGIVYKLEIYSKEREDVAEILKSQDAICSGINVFFDEEKIPKGKYIIGVLFEKDRRFVKWSTEIFER